MRCTPSEFPSRSHSPDAAAFARTDGVVYVGGPFGVLPPLPSVLASREVGSF